MIALWPTSLTDCQLPIRRYAFSCSYVGVLLCRQRRHVGVELFDAPDIQLDAAGKASHLKRVTDCAAAKRIGEGALRISILLVGFVGSSELFLRKVDEFCILVPF